MRNTANEAGGKLIAVNLRAVNPLIEFTISKKHAILSAIANTTRDMRNSFTF
jgi:hypothetical protein